MDKLKITKRSELKGDDGYKTFSIRIRDNIAARLEELAKNTNRSRNELVNIILDFGLDNCEIDEK